MPSHPDPLLMLADIARLASNHPDMDPGLVRALYQHLLMVQGRQPSIDEVREYVERLTTELFRARYRDAGARATPLRPAAPVRQITSVLVVSPQAIRRISSTRSWVWGESRGETTAR